MSHLNAERVGQTDYHHRHHWEGNEQDALPLPCAWAILVGLGDNALIGVTLALGRRSPPSLAGISQSGAHVWVLANRLRTEAQSEGNSTEKDLFFPHRNNAGRIAFLPRHQKEKRITG